MSKNNVRIAIRDSTDSHNVAFFDNKAGIKYKSANLHRFLAGSASILTIKYNSKDIDTIRSGCKLAFRYKNRDYWLNVMSFEKKGFEVELTAYSLGLELNNETRGEHKPANAMSITEYVAYYDPEHALTIGVNEVSDKRIKLEWTGTDTILARLFSVANSFGAELDFNVELNDDYSLKRQVLNIYKKGNLGTNKVSQPVRVGKELKVINYSDNIKELRTAVRATGKDGLTIDGLDKKIYDNNKELLYYSSGMTVYAPQSRDRFPSVGKGSNDNWIVEDLGETQYETKEALWGYLYSEIQKKSVPEITYEVEGAVDAGIGDTQTLIDDKHFEPALYVQARVSELEDDILTGKVTKSTFINFERKYSQIADILLKQVEALAEDAAPYIIRLSTNNGYIFKNGEGSSTITARLEKYSKDIAATWKWVVDNKVVGTGDKLTVKAEQVTNTMAVTVIAYVNGNEVVRDYMTFSNSDDGVGVESIDRYFTSSDQSDGVTIEGAEWSDKPPAPTEDGKYLWAYDEITYTDGTVTTTKPAAVGANFDVDAFRAEIAEDLKDVPNREEFENKIAEELANSKAEIETQIETAKTQAESNAKEYADTINEETAKVAELANAAAGEIKADLVNVKNNLTETSLVANNAQAAVDAAKQELTNVTSELNTAKQDLMSHAQQLQTQANAQTELTKRVTTVETTANGTKTTVSELSKTVDSNTKNITSVTARTKTVEDDLSGTKTTLSQVKTTADSASQKTATLETGLNGLSARFENLSVGTTNHFLDSAFETTIQKIGIFQNGNVYTPSIDTTEKYYGYNTLKIVCNDSTGVDNPKITYPALAKLKTVQQGKLPDVVTISFWSKSNTEGMVLYTRLGFTNYESSQNVTLTTDWKRYIVHVRTSSAATNEWLFKFSKAGTVWIAKPQFEFAAIASDYHTAEEDTSSKVAEYKQNADQNYARLQSNLQTLDGTVKQNKSEFDQTASQIKSSISAVESKIPTNVSTRNLILKSNDFENPHKQNGANTTITATEGYFVIRSTGYTANAWGGMSWNMSISEVKAGEDFSILMPVYIDSSIPLDAAFAFHLKNHSSNSAAYGYDIPTNKKDQWFNVAITFKASKDVVFDTYPFYVFLAKNGLVRIKPPMLVRGNLIPRDYQPAFEDTASDVTKLNTTLTQTADGLRQLSTQVTSQGSTINTHTTQISALNTGLQAKVSQSEFNTLSGRVTNAENNITAKANELSSKITSVEGKIPTNLDSLNLMTGTRDWSTKANKWHMGPYWSTESGEYQGLKVHSTQNGYNGSHQNIFVKNGDVVTFSFFAKATNTLSKIKVSSRWADSSVYQAPLAGVRESDEEITITSEWKRYSKTVHITSDGSLQFRAEYNGATIPNGNTFYVAGLKLAKSSQDTGYSENPTDLASDISSVEGKIPTSVSQRNLVQGTSVAWSPFVNITTNNNWRYNLATINYGDRTGIYAGTTINIFVYLSADEIVLDSSINPQFFIQGEIIDKNGNVTWTNWDKYHPFHNKWSTNLVSGNNYRIVKISSKVTNESYSNINGFKIEVRINGVKSGKFHHRALMVTTGDVFPDSWQPAPEDAFTQISSVSSEFKQTTDAIKASVSSLDNSTVKSSSLTINADGIVMKAGKSTTDVANAIGSYFAVNQNAINLFSDKINVKGNMIVNGAITSDKIASKQINTAHLNGKVITAEVISSNAVTADAIKAGAVTTDKMSANSINGDRITAGTLDAAKIKAGSITASQIASGTITSAQIKTGTISAANIAAGAITADKIAANSINSSKIVSSGITANVIKGGTLQSVNGSTNFELNTGKLFYNNNNTGVFRVQNGASTMGLKFSNTPITVSGTSRILSRAILGGDRNETTLDDGKWDKGGFSGIVIETIKGAIPAANEHADSLRAISDTIYFTHTYSADSPTGVSAHGWKMETYAPDSSYSGNIVLKPYGINYRQSDIVVGDIRLDNGDGSGYWVRATINTLKACFGHILNGGTSSQALNAIRSELNKISGT